MTFTEIVTEVQARLNLTSTESATRIGREVNDRYRRITASIGLVTTRRETVQKNATLGVSELVFSGIERLINVVDRSASPYRVLTETTVEDLRAHMPFGGGLPRRYAVLRHGSSTVTILMSCVPQSEFTLYADGYANQSTLSGSNVPAFPESFHDVLYRGVLADEYAKMEKLKLSQTEENAYEQRLGQLRLFLASSSYKDIQFAGLKDQQSIPSVSGGSGGDGPTGSESYTQTGLITFERAPLPPYAVEIGSAKVDNLDADLLDGEDGSAYHNASNLNAGTVPDARFPATLPAISGANLTNLDASDLASGTIPDARFPATLPALNGSALTNLNASALASGTVPVARLAAGTFTVVTSTATGATNDWAPGLVGNTLIRWNGASSIALTGVAGGVVGQIVLIHNITAAQLMTLAHNSGSSSAANRLQNVATSAATPVGPGGHAAYQFNGTDWSLILHNSSWITPTFAAGDYTADSGTWTVDSGDVATLRYRIEGKNMKVLFEINGTDVSATPTELRRAIPGGFTVGSGTRTSIQIVNNGAAIVGGGLAYVTSANAFIGFLRDHVGTTYTITASDNTSVRGQMDLEIT